MVLTWEILQFKIRNFVHLLYSLLLRIALSYTTCPYQSHSLVVFVLVSDLDGYKTSTLSGDGMGPSFEALTSQPLVYPPASPSFFFEDGSKSTL